MPKRTFTLAPPTTDDPPEFTLEGVGQIDGQPWSLTFHCLGTCPAAALDDMARSVGVNAAGDYVFNNVSVIRFFRQVVVPDEEHELEAFIADKNRVVQIEELGDVLMWLAETYTARPTDPSSGSPATPSTDGGSSPASSV